MKKLWWGIFVLALIAVLWLAPENNFSRRVWELFYTLRDSVVAWYEQTPEKIWLIVGAFLPLIFTIVAGIGHLFSMSDRRQELYIKAFVPLLAATLALYGAFITDIAGWGR